MSDKDPLAQAIGLEGFATETSGIGGVLKARVSDFRVDEISTSIKLDNKGRFTVAKITLTNGETNRFCTNLARELKIPRNRIFFAGTKDKRAVTSHKFLTPLGLLGAVLLLSESECFPQRRRLPSRITLRHNGPRLGAAPARHLRGIAFRVGDLLVLLELLSRVSHFPVLHVRESSIQVRNPIRQSMPKQLRRIKIAVLLFEARNFAL